MNKRTQIQIIADELDECGIETFTQNNSVFAYEEDQVLTVEMVEILLGELAEACTFMSAGAIGRWGVLVMPS